jgi:3-oxoacyl-[acyl-carrier protein] reductase
MTGARLDGKVAIVTGAAAVSRGAGMGRAISELFGREGARVVAVDMSPAVEETAERIRRAGGDAVAVPADVEQRADVERVVRTVVDRYGRVDVLVNVVGGSIGERSYMDVTDDLFERILRRNLLSTHLCCQVTIPRMVEGGGGSIVHISSTNALMGCPGLAVYSGAKSGLIGFSRVLATEFGPRGVRSNVICPGIMGRGEPDPRQPLGRAASADDIAKATLFFASDDAAFVTAQVLAVDGGHTTTYPDIF